MKKVSLSLAENTLTVVIQELWAMCDFYSLFILIFPNFYNKCLYFFPNRFIA